MDDGRAVLRCDPVPEDQATQVYLEDLSRALMEAVNRRQADPLLLDFICPFYSTYFQYSRLPTRESKAENNNHLRGILAQNPGYKIKVINICSNVDLTQHKAQVWVTVRASGLQNDRITRERVSVLDWIRRKKDWHCIKHMAILGPGGWTLPE